MLEPWRAFFTKYNDLSWHCEGALVLVYRGLCVFLTNVNFKVRPASLAVCIRLRQVRNLYDKRGFMTFQSDFTTVGDAIDDLYLVFVGPCRQLILGNELMMKVSASYHTL